MIHNTINGKSDHWAVALSACSPNILVQLQEDGNQARVVLNIIQARDLVASLITHINKLNTAQKAKEI